MMTLYLSIPFSSRSEFIVCFKYSDRLHASTTTAVDHPVRSLHRVRSLVRRIDDIQDTIEGVLDPPE